MRKLGAGSLLSLVARLWSSPKVSAQAFGRGLTALKRLGTSTFTECQSRNCEKGRREKSGPALVLPTVDNGTGTWNRGGTLYGRASSNISSELCYAFIVATHFIVNPPWSNPPCYKNKTGAPVDILFAGCADVDGLFHKVISRPASKRYCLGRYARSRSPLLGMAGNAY